MIKRIYLLLLPVLVLMLIVDYKGYNNLVQSGDVLHYGYSATGNSHVRTSRPESLNKQSNRKIKNAIRIKAWEGAVAIACSHYYEGRQLCDHCVRPVFIRYDSGLTEQTGFLYSLRGPPESAILS